MWLPACVRTPSCWTKSAGASSGSRLRGGFGAGALPRSFRCGGCGAGSSVGVLARFRFSRLLRRGVISTGSGSSGSVAMGGSSRFQVLCRAGFGCAVGWGGGVVGGCSGGVVVVGCGVAGGCASSIGGALRSNSLTWAASSRIGQGITVARGVLFNEGSTRIISEVSYCFRGGQRGGIRCIGHSPGSPVPRPPKTASPAAGRCAQLRARLGGAIWSDQLST